MPRKMLAMVEQKKVIAKTAADIVALLLSLERIAEDMTKQQTPELRHLYLARADAFADAAEAVRGKYNVM